MVVAVVVVVWWWWLIFPRFEDYRGSFDDLFPAWRFFFFFFFFPSGVQLAHTNFTF